MDRTEKIIAVVAALFILALLVFRHRPLTEIVTASDEPPTGDFGDIVGASNVTPNARGSALLTYNLPWRFSPPVQMLPTITEDKPAEQPFFAGDCGC